MPAEFFIPIVMFAIGAIVVISIAVVAIRIGREIRRKPDDKPMSSAESYSPYSGRSASGSTSSKSTTMTAEQRDRLDYLREKYAKQQAVDKHERHVADANEHEHQGEEEHYEEIVGSLGEVNDEGCEDLSGVRFIAHDLAYELDDNDALDYTGLAKSMVLGEIINTPRFKQPYHKK